MFPKYLKLIKLSRVLLRNFILLSEDLTINRKLFLNNGETNKSSQRSSRPIGRRRTLEQLPVS